MDLMKVYHQVMDADRLKDFPEEQLQLLLEMAKVDPDYAIKHANFTLAKSNDHNCRVLRKGNYVKLHALKTNANWNGKRGKIIGEKVMKNNVVRWPVRLLDGSGARALLRGRNLIYLSHSK